MKVKVIKGLVTHSGKDYKVGKSFTCNQVDGKHLIDAGFCVEVEDKKKQNRQNIEGKDFETLSADVDLAKDLDLE